jgi:hypothetical protein
MESQGTRPELTESPRHATDSERASAWVPDAHTVFRDALSFTSWTVEGGSLPQRGDWSTYRLAAKDIILGVVTHRYNATTRTLDVRSYFCGEHPLFRDLEPTRALVVMLLCQAFQTGNSLQLNFEQGVPFDVRTLIEERTGKVISGHASVLPREITEPLFVNLSGVSSRLEGRIKDHGVGVGTVCYQIFRGTWTALQINALLDRRIPLAWLFRKTPHAVGNAVSYMHLVSHLCLALLEEYAIKRLENRQFGETTSRRISVVEEAAPSTYVAEHRLTVEANDGAVHIAGSARFTFIPLLVRTTAEIRDLICDGIARVNQVPANTRAVLVLPMDLLSDAAIAATGVELLRSAKIDWLTVGQSMAQLLAEVDQKLAITADQIDENELDASNVDRHTD